MDVFGPCLDAKCYISLKTDLIELKTFWGNSLGGDMFMVGDLLLGIMKCFSSQTNMLQACNRFN